MALRVLEAEDRLVLCESRQFGTYAIAADGEIPGFRPRMVESQPSSSHRASYSDALSLVDVALLYCRRPSAGVWCSSPRRTTWFTQLSDNGSTFPNSAPSRMASLLNTYQILQRLGMFSEVIPSTHDQQRVLVEDTCTDRFPSDAFGEVQFRQ